MKAHAISATRRYALSAFKPTRPLEARWQAHAGPGRCPYGPDLTTPSPNVARRNLPRNIRQPFTEGARSWQPGMSYCMLGPRMAESMRAVLSRMFCPNAPLSTWAPSTVGGFDKLAGQQCRVMGPETGSETESEAIGTGLGLDAF